MRPIYSRIIAILIFLTVIFTGVIGAYAYNRGKAAAYANLWWDKWNDVYDYYSNDCANFVSQCLIDGGLMVGTDISDAGKIPGVSVNHIKKGGAISTISSLMPYLENYEHAEKIIALSPAGLDEVLEIGDPVFFGYSLDNMTHSMIVSSKVNGIVYLAAHTNNTNGDTLSEVVQKDNYTQIIAYHFPDRRETGVAARFYGTGSYYGEDTLNMIIHEEGTNYEGYIVDNLDDSDQDLVVGENTSQLNGCAHFISAYCSDAHKGIPNQGQGFGQPWTSNDPNHWAYWARQAVIYGNNNSFSSRDILNAIWYITDRSGSYNQILSSIGYPTDGPDKNITGYTYGIPADSIKLIHNKFNPLQGERMTVYYRISSAGAVKVALYTLDGALVTTLVDDPAQAAGTYSLTWDGRNDLFETVASGIYLVHIQGPGFKATKKACVIK